MKRALSFILAVVMVALMIPVTVSANDASPLTAKYAWSINVDGVKDSGYPDEGLAVGDSATDGVYGTAYFARDDEYLYVFVEVTDSTIAPMTADKTGTLGGTNDSFANLAYNDGVVIGYNFGGVEESTAYAGQISNEDDANGGAYFYQRSKKTSVGATGRHVFAPSSTTGAKWADLNNYLLKAAGTDTATGYTAEFRIPFGKTAKNTPVDVDALVESGIGIMVQISDSTVGANAVSGEKATAANYIFSGAGASNLAVWGAKVYPAGQNGFEKLELAEAYNRYETITAVKTAVAPTLDGKLDSGVYLSMPYHIEGRGYYGDTVSADVYFAYDDDNLYVFANVVDTTVGIHAAAKTDNSTAAAQGDAFWLGINVGDTTPGLDVYNVAGIKAVNDNAGLYAVLRGGDGNISAIQGGYSFLNKSGYAVKSVSTEDGYTAEMVIPLGKTDFEGNAVTNLVEGGEIAIAAFLNNYIGDNSCTDGNKNDITRADFSSNGGKQEWIQPSYYRASPRSTSCTANNGDVASWDKLVFGSAAEVVRLDVDDSSVTKAVLGGSTLDLSSMTVKAVYDNGAELTVSNYTVDVDGVTVADGYTLPFDEGEHTVTVTFGGVSQNFVITVSNKFQSVVASSASSGVVVDGTKDAIYDLNAPLTISGTNDEDGSELSAKMWFAYDANYIYVYGEVIDSTTHVNTEADTGNITPLSKNDSLILSLNVDPAQTYGPECSIWTAAQAGNINANRDASGIFGVMRGATAKSNLNSRSGGYAWGTVLNEGTQFALSSKDVDGGYVVEFAIPWMKSLTEGQNFYDMAMENGIAIRGTLINSLSDKGATFQVLHSEPVANPTGWRDLLYPITNTGAYTYNRLTFRESTSYTLGFTDENDGALSSVSCLDGETVTLPAYMGTVADGDLFIGWTIDGVLYPAGASYQVTADTTAKANIILFDALDGASVRMKEILDENNAFSLEQSAAVSGIRFVTKFNHGEVAALTDGGLTVETGTLIFPKDLLGDNTLTLDTTGVVKNGTTYNVTRLVNQGNAKYAPEKAYDCFVGSLVNLKTSNFNRDFVGASYITITYANGTSVTYYSYRAEARSIVTVATAALADPNGNYTENQKLILNRYIGG